MKVFENCTCLPPSFLSLSPSPLSLRFCLVLMYMYIYHGMSYTSLYVHTIPIAAALLDHFNSISCQKVRTCEGIRGVSIMFTTPPSSQFPLAAHLYQSLLTMCQVCGVCVCGVCVWCVYVVCVVCVMCVLCVYCVCVQYRTLALCTDPPCCTHCI